jgi:hypothetical protein
MEKIVTEKESHEIDDQICAKCGQPMLRLPDGKYDCECQAKKDSNEEDPNLDLGYDIRGFV